MSDSKTGHTSLSTILRFALFTAAALGLPCTGANAQFVTLDDPHGTLYTLPNGISGSNIVGTWYNGTTNDPFLYDGTNYSSVLNPGNASYGLIGISGTTELGWYDSATVLTWYTNNQGVYTTLNPFLPASVEEVTGISGSNIVGYTYANNGQNYGFLYNGTSLTTLSDPIGIFTELAGVDGANIVGQVELSNGSSEGFLYNGSSFTPIIDPLATGETIVRAISGNDIVGDFTDSSGDHGFIYDGSTWTTYNVPVVGAIQTKINGISGNSIIGQYYDSGNHFHGFVDTIDLSPAATPEPNRFATLIGLGVFGTAALLRRRRCKG